MSATQDRIDRLADLVELLQLMLDEQQERNRAAIALHHEYRGVCTHCVDSRNPPTWREAWPCETVKILTGEADG